eukprot:2944259-Prymnesium_polylepis.1
MRRTLSRATCGRPSHSGLPTEESSLSRTASAKCLTGSRSRTGCTPRTTARGASVLIPSEDTS